MSRRNTKKTEPKPEIVEEIDEVEESVDEVDEVEEVQPVVEIERQNTLRKCISCGSTANLYKTKVHKTCIECLNLRPGKSEKQLESFKKAREKRMENVNRRKSEIAEIEKQAKEQLDKKIVSKAISIKKKLIKQNAELDVVSDDDTPLEEVMQIAKKKPVVAKKQNLAKRVTISKNHQESQPDEYVHEEQHIPQIRTFNFL